jgi:hypothetical protein
LSDQHTGDPACVPDNGGVPLFETKLEKIEREQAEAKNRDTLYRGEQLKINRQQLKVNSRLMVFTGLLVFTSVVTGGISLYQARVSKIASRAAEDAANAACLGSQIARSTLLEYQRSAEDSHLASAAAYAQALVAMESQKTFVDADFEVPENRLYDKPLSLIMRLKNTGKSDASNVRITGWAIVANPDSHWISPIPKKKMLFSVQIGSLKVGQQFLPEVSGTTKEGNPHGLYVSLLNDAGDEFVNTAELDKAVFVEGNRTIFAFYTISYEDFTAKYIRQTCARLFYWQNGAATAFNGSISNQCNDYNKQTETPKIPVPIPSKLAPAEQVSDIPCTPPPK